MDNCGHASGVTYKGCMKCDLDRLKDRIAELEANQAGERCDHCGCDRIYSGPPDCPRCGAPNCCEICCNEQTQADRIAELEAEKKSLFTAAKPHLKENKKLQATIYEIEGLPDKWSAQAYSYFSGNGTSMPDYVNELRAIIKRQSE